MLSARNHFHQHDCIKASWTSSHSLNSPFLQDYNFRYSSVLLRAKGIERKWAILQVPQTYNTASKSSTSSGMILTGQLCPQPNHLKFEFNIQGFSHCCRGSKRGGGRRGEEKVLQQHQRPDRHGQRSSQQCRKGSQPVNKPTNNAASQVLLKYFWISSKPLG